MEHHHKWATKNRSKSSLAMSIKEEKKTFGELSYTTITRLWRDKRLHLHE
jgi:hypothetical protein